MNTFCRVPIGFHFDYLSILGVKHENFGDNKVLEDYKQCCVDLREQIGDKKFEEMISSKEYLELYEANAYLFQLVDMIKVDPLRGKELDDQVYVRWQKKKALQEKFYPQSEFGEKKYGY